MSCKASNRELLELAAKASGIKLLPYTWDKGAPWGEHEGFTIEGEGPDEWNPLEDDGAALRLAVAAGIDLQQFTQSRHVEAWAVGIDAVSFDYGSDPMAATRLAIVRAAAAITQAAN